MEIRTLTPAQIAAAWRNPSVAEAWPAELRAQLPVNPAGIVDAASLLDVGTAAESRHNTQSCNTNACFSHSCASLLCHTSRYHCR